MDNHHNEFFYDDNIEFGWCVWRSLEFFLPFVANSIVFKIEKYRSQENI